MIKTCPVCNRDFESLVVNSTYCNISCRKKAGREKEKLKRSAFYQAPEAGFVVELLHSENCPTLARLHDLAKMIHCVVTTIRKPRYVNIYGPLPEGWADGECFIVEAIGASPPCHVLGANVDVSTATSGPLPTVYNDRELAMKRQLLADEEAERQVMAEL